MKPFPVGTTFYKRSSGKHRIITVLDYVLVEGSQNYFYLLGESVIDEDGNVNWLKRKLFHSEIEKYLQLDESHFLSWKRIDNLKNFDGEIKEHK